MILEEAHGLAGAQIFSAILARGCRVKNPVFCAARWIRVGCQEIAHQDQDEKNAARKKEDGYSRKADSPQYETYRNKRLEAD